MILLLQALKAGTTLKFHQADNPEVVSLLNCLDHLGLVQVEVANGLVAAWVPPEKLERFSPTRSLVLYEQKNIRDNLVVLQAPAKMALGVFKEVSPERLPTIPGAFYGASFCLPDGITYVCRGNAQVSVTKKDKQGTSTAYMAVSSQEFVVWLYHKERAITTIYGVPTVTSRMHMGA